MNILRYNLNKVFEILHYCIYCYCYVLQEQISSLEKKITPDFLVNAADAINKFASENEHFKV